MAAGVTRDDSGAKAFDKLLNRANDLKAKVGFFEDSKYDDGTPVAYVAAIQEFGYPKGRIPPRSFMRTTFKAENKKWSDLMAKELKKALTAEGAAASADHAFERVSAKAAGDVRKTIANIQSPPLSPVTLQLRSWARAGIKINMTKVRQAATLVKKGVATGATGSAAKPLVFDGILLNAVTNEVSTGE